MAADVAITCESLGVAFTRGSRRTMLRKSFARALRSRNAPAEGGYYDDPSTFWALRDLSFELGTGSVLGLCGVNGAGKTTLLRTISGIYQPDAGRIRVQGRTSVLLSLGAMLAANLSGRANARMSAALHGIPNRDVERHVAEVQAFAELDDATMETPVRFYSAGMKARLAFASASVLAPEILLIDELLGVGDAAFYKKSTDRIRELTDSAHCVVVASHSAAFLRQVCQTVMWLDQGRLVQSGPAADVLDGYLAVVQAKHAPPGAAATQGQAGQGQAGQGQASPDP